MLYVELKNTDKHKKLRSSVMFLSTVELNYAPIIWVFCNKTYFNTLHQTLEVDVWQGCEYASGMGYSISFGSFAQYKIRGIQGDRVSISNYFCAEQ